eukprot:120262_1
MKSSVEVIEEGWIEKKSRFVGAWKRRWAVIGTVITQTTHERAIRLLTYKNSLCTEEPTESIRLRFVSSVQSTSDNTFFIETEDLQHFEFKTESQSKATKWINNINKYRNNCIEMPITIECIRNAEYNCKFLLPIPFDDDYEYHMNELLTDVMNHLHTTSGQFKFNLTRIKSNSFIGFEMNYNDYDWTDSKLLITDYQKNTVEQVGLFLETDLQIYKHDITTYEQMCDDMKTEKGLCEIYAKMRYQDIFTEEYLQHLYEYKHPEVECKYADNCYTFQRLEAGWNDLKDRCHIMIYTHPPRNRRKSSGLAENIKSFCMKNNWAANVPLYHPNEEDKKGSNFNERNGFLKPLINEVITNGFKSDLCITDQDAVNNNYSILQFVNEKLNCMRHKLMGSPLNRAEMLSIILYTGGDSTYDLCSTQRDG